MFIGKTLPKPRSVGDCSRFVNDHSATAQPFVKNCGFDTRGSANSGIISLPSNISNNNNSSYNCIWSIQAPPGSYLTLQVTDFSLSSSNDRLYILQPTICLPFATSTAHPAYYTSEMAPAAGASMPLYQNSAAIYLYAEVAAAKSSISLTWFTTSPVAPDCTEAVRHLIGPSPAGDGEVGFIKNCGFDTTPLGLLASRSLRYPPLPATDFDEPSRVFCAWRLQEPAGSHIVLNFSYLHLRGMADRLIILRPRDGCSLVTQLSGVLARDQVSSSVETDADDVALYLVADGQLAYRGFLLNWTAVTTLTTTGVASNAVASGNGAAVTTQCLPAIGPHLPRGYEDDLGQNCGMDFTRSSAGAIQFPANSNSSRRCVWNILAPAAQR